MAMSATKAPGYVGNGSVLASVISTEARIGRETIPVIAIEACGRPTLLIEESGEARLVRPRRRRSSYSDEMVYVSPKVFVIDNPKEQPISALFSLYERALRDVGGSDE